MVWGEPWPDGAFSTAVSWSESPGSPSDDVQGDVRR